MREDAAATGERESRGLFKNTLAQSAPVLSTFVFGFVLAPIMLDRLGLAQFGIWAVTGALAQYARLLDLGITNSISRFVALYDAEGNRRAVEETIGVGLLAAGFVSLVMLVLAVATTPLVHDVLGVIGAGEMRVVLLSAAGIAGANLLAAVISSVPIGLRRMGPPNVAATLGNVVNFLGSIAALVFSTRLDVYALANLGAAVAGLVFAVVALVWVWARPFLRRPTRARGMAIIGFGVKSQLVILADLVNVQTDKLIIAALLGPKTAGAYEIANRVVQGVLSLGILTLSAMIPTATADLVKRGRQVIAEYMGRYTVRSLAISFPLFGAVCISAPYLLEAWLGEVPADSVSVIVLLSLAFAINLVTGVAMTLVVADGHPGVVAQTAGLLVALNLGATLFAAPIFGFWGVLLATVLAQIVVSVIFMVRFHRRYELGYGPFLEAVAKPAAVVLGAAAPYGVWYLLGGGGADGRGPAFLGVLLTGGVYFVVVWLIESRMELLPERLGFASVRRRLSRTIGPSNA
jgi:O-antigen/teichoic acid export membrane protein